MVGSDLSVEAGSLDAVWGWQPVTSAWFDRLQANLRLFAFHPGLSVDDTGLRMALLKAAETGEPWLIHPALSVVTDTTGETQPSLGRHLLLAVWLAAHSPIELCTAILEHETLLWGPSGPRMVPAGRYDIMALGAELAADAGLGSIWLDPAGTTLDLQLNDAWPLGDDPEADGHHRAICAFLKMIALIDDRLPALSRWASRVTRIIVPFGDQAPHGETRSSSSPFVPGLIRMDLGYGGMRILECLTHETAHHYFYHAEAVGPFVSAQGAERLFPSPLKRQLRPLRGVMLAYHALAYIGAAFATLAEAGVVADGEAFEAEMTLLRELVLQAEETCIGARAFLTDEGRCFLESTKKVARYGFGRN